ncbi:radical SAM protein [Hyphobacterium sp. CCMP332]|nr:radical SAM protein [Hyphobacterium sp. CCMP332]
MKVLLINPAFSKIIDDNLERYFLGAGMRFPWSLLKKKNERPRYAMFPFFMAYSAALLEKEGFDARVIDAVPLNLSENELMEKIEEFSPDVLVFEPNSAMIDKTLILAKRIKSQIDSTIVFTGSHSTHFAKEILIKNEYVDIIVNGEYEMKLKNLCETLKKGEDVSFVKGIWYRDNFEIQFSGEGEAINLSNLPYPARHLMPAWFDNDMSLYNDGFCQNKPSFHVHSSRGCPYRCNFCDRIQVLFNNGAQRFREVSDVVDEMEFLINEYGAKEIYFDDDNFTSDYRHVHALCEEINRRGLKIAWSAMSDVMALKEDTLNKMAEAGCIGIKFGLDSADARVLKETNKPLKLENLEKIVNRARKLGIKTHMSVVLGLKGETRLSLQKTFDYSCKVDIDSIQFSLATPIPGTSFYMELEQKGDLQFSSWEEFDGANSTVIRYDDFDKEYIESFMSKSHSTWLRRKFFNPLWLFRQFRFLKRTSESQGIKGLINRAKRAFGLLTGDWIKIQKKDLKGYLRY